MSEDIFCKCGEYIAIKNKKTNQIDIDSGVEYLLEDSKVIAICPYCDDKINIEGKLKVSK